MTQDSLLYCAVTPGVVFEPLHENCRVKLQLLPPSEDVELPGQAGAEQPGRLVDQVPEQVPG